MTVMSWLSDDVTLTAQLLLIPAYCWVFIATVPPLIVCKSQFTTVGYSENEKIKKMSE